MLGTLLFLAYINDLPGSLRTSGGRQPPQLHCQQTSSRETWQPLKNVKSFNPTKRTVIRVTSGKSKKTHKSNYILYGHTLDVVDISKYLGVTVSEDLSWTKHISETASKANRSLGVLRLLETNQSKNVCYCC